LENLFQISGYRIYIEEEPLLLWSSRVWRNVTETSQLYIVIPVLNGWSQTKRCLDALRASSYRDFRILVVDHGSTDETEKELPEKYPEVFHIIGDESLWWAGATNLGIRKAILSGATHVMLLNNDCYVKPYCIGKLIRNFKKNRICIVAPLLISEISGEISNTRFRTCLLLGFPSIRMPYFLTRSSMENGLMRVPLILGGRGVIIPVGVFKKVGLLDEENLSHYWADHDFFIRCRREKIPLYLDPSTEAVLDDTRTTLAVNLEEMKLKDFLETLVSRRSHRNLRELSHFFKKHYPIRIFFPIGVTLNLLRYCTMYMIYRIWHLIKIRN
jgi:GT2 family glycosyltransferase